jgi:oxygen-independent coproporphyrinogen-3 oxidase
MPTADGRLQILSLAIDKLTEAGYVFIGMDHFAKPDDELAVAQREGGCIAISRAIRRIPTATCCPSASRRSARSGRATPEREDARRVLRSLDNGRAAGLPRHRADADDILRRAIIQSLMCHFELSFDAVEAAYGIDFRSYFATELAALDEMVQGGLVRIEERRIVVLPPGRMLVRAISMAFDRYLRADRESKRYSKVISVAGNRRAEQITLVADRSQDRAGIPSVRPSRHPRRRFPDATVCP